MPLRIVDDPAQLDQAYAALKSALTAWAGPGAHAWAAQGGLEPAGEGASFARRDDVHLYLERTDDRIAIGVALTAHDRDLLRLEFLRDAPARRKRRLAIAVEDDGAFALLISTEALADQDIRDPLKRLAGAPLAKRADIGGRDFVLLAPLGEPRIADALAAVAGLSPHFERHIAQLGDLAAGEDARMKTALYEISPRVARTHKVQRRVVAALHEKLAGAGFQLDEAEAGPLKADFVMSRGAESLVFEIRGDAEIADLVRGLGQLTLVAPKGASLTRVLVLPAPRQDIGQAIAAFYPALDELSVNVLLYDLSDAGMSFHFDRVDATLPRETRALFA